MLRTLSQLLTRDSEHTSRRPAASRKRRSTRIALEILEDRTVPAAIRNLPGFLTNTLPANDDGSTGAVNVGFTLNFFGMVDNQVFVNNNGNVTLDQPLSDFTPNDLNSDNGGIPIIAAFFADVDTTGPGSGLVQYGTDVLCGRPVFGINYINVGYFNAHTDKLNSFQIILVDRSETGTGNFDIEYNYDSIQWETGDASGGTNGLGGQSARVGYSNGSGVSGTFFELPGSGVPGSFINGGPNALNTTTVLATTPGRIHFLVRNGQVVQESDMTAQVNLDVSDQVRVLNPFRWITDADTGTMRGNLTLVNINPRSIDPGSNAVDICLDIVASSGPPTGQPVPGPITVILAPPAGITIANRDGATATDRAYITSNISALPFQFPALRVPVVITNASLAAPTTFFIGNFSPQVISGAFDPDAI